MTGARSDDRLQQYFDGELTGADAGTLERELEESTELRAKLEGLAHLRTLLVAATEEQGDELDSESMWSTIEARLGTAAADDDPMFPAEPDPEPVRRPLDVIPGGAKAKPAERQPKARSNVVWIGFATTLAIAAAVLLAVMRPFHLGGHEGKGEPIAEAPPPGSEVEEVDFGYSTGAVFSVEGREGERYAVVWISDEKPTLDDTNQERL
jgi:hypothetical protein